jgi:hypothetical protein
MKQNLIAAHELTLNLGLVTELIFSLTAMISEIFGEVDWC